MCNEKKRRRSDIMSNYRAKIKCQKVSETGRKLKLDAQKKVHEGIQKEKIN